MDTGGGKLDVLHEIVVRMAPDRLMLKTRASDPETMTSYSESLGTRDVQGLAGVGLGGVECDALDGSLRLHSAQGLFAVTWKEVRWHGHRVYIYVYDCVYVFCLCFKLHMYTFAQSWQKADMIP